MYVKEINEEITKRIYYGNRYGYNGNSTWYSYRWLLWLLLLIPLLIVVILFCVRKRKNKGKVHVVDNNQYYQTQQAGGYYNQGQGNQYDNQYPPPNPDAGVGAGGYGGYNQQQGYTGQGYNEQQGYSGTTANTVNADEFQRPEGPPPAHYKS